MTAHRAVDAKSISPPRESLILAGLEMRVAAPVQLVVGVPHGLGARLAEHHLEVHRLQALVHVAVDDARRTRDALPRPEPDVDALAALVLDERGEVALQHEEYFLDLVRVRGVALARLDVHDRQGEPARRDDARIPMLARAARADKAVLRPLVALDLR